MAVNLKTFKRFSILVTKTRLINMLRAQGEVITVNNDDDILVLTQKVGSGKFENILLEWTEETEEDLPRENSSTL